MRWLLLVVVVSSCHREASDPKDQAEEQTWVDLAVGVPAEHQSGFVLLVANEAIDVYIAFATFLAPGPNTGVRMGAIVEDPLEGMDDCGRLRYTNELDVAPGAPRTPLDPGDLTITAPDGTVVSFDYYAYVGTTADLGFAGLEPTPGDHRVAGTGGDLGSFSLDVPLPPELVLTSPDPGPLPWGDVEFRWTGSSDGVVRLDLVAPATEGSTSVTCVWADDGAAELPGDVVDGVTGGFAALSRIVGGEATLEDGAVIGFEGRAVLE